jgi:hypothetical protein
MSYDNLSTRFCINAECIPQGIVSLKKYSYAKILLILENYRVFEALFFPNSCPENRHLWCIKYPILRNRAVEIWYQCIGYLLFMMVQKLCKVWRQLLLNCPVCSSNMSINLYESKNLKYRVVSLSFEKNCDPFIFIALTFYIKSKSKTHNAAYLQGKKKLLLQNRLYCKKDLAQT